MTDQRATFGSLLQAARERAGFRTQAALADYLSTLGYPYSDAALGHWETGRSVPPREVLLVVLSALARRGGLRWLAEVNRMLWLLDQRNLDEAERMAHFAQLAAAPLLPDLPERPYDRLIGREALVEALAARLADPVGKAVVVLSGLGGIG
jgi:hypothetical protein